MPLPQLVGTGFQVLFHSPPGVLFTFPSQYSALSVTGGVQPCGVVPAASRRVPRVLRYSGSCRLPRGFAYRALTSCGAPFHASSAPPSGRSWQSTTPPRVRSGLGPPGFARRYSRVRFFFLFLRLLRCFSSPGAPRAGYVFARRWPGLPRPGSPIRTPADHRACAPPRSFSQLVASFFGPPVPRHPSCALPCLTSVSAPR